MVDAANTPPPPVSPGGPAPITDRRRWPAGVMPPHLQQWVIAGVAAVMIVILALAGPPKPTGPTGQRIDATPVAVDPNTARIEEYQRRITDQAQRLTAEQAQLELAKQAIANPGSGKPGPGAPAAPIAPTALISQRQEVDSVAYSRGSGGAEPASGRTGTSAEPAGSPASAPVAPKKSGGLKFRVREGTVIDTVLTNRLEGSFQGPVNTLVSVPTYADDHLVIPAGARILGDSKPVNAFGQTRLVVTFHRVLLPGGDRIDLDAVPALDQAGALGLTDQVNRHYGQIFGASIALGLLAGFTEGQSPAGLEATADDRYRQGVASSLGQSGTRILDRFLNLLPTVTIREGHRIKVYMTRDLELPAYVPAPSVAGGQR